jgi:hypothetical protein
MKKTYTLAASMLWLFLLVTGSAQAQPIPIGHWTFDEASFGTGTGIVLDSTAGKHSGNIGGSAVYVPGIIGTGALSFDGIDDHVDFGLVPALDLTGGNYTIAFWLKYDKPQLGRIINMDDGINCSAGYSVFLSEVMHISEPYMRVRHNIGVCNDSQQVSRLFKSPPAGGWHHVAMVYDTVRKTITAYNDGVSSQVFSLLYPGDLKTDGDDPLLFGTSSAVASVGWLKGSLDDVRLYDVALNSAEISKLAVVGETAAQCPCFSKQVVFNACSSAETASTATVPTSCKTDPKGLGTCNGIMLLCSFSNGKHSPMFLVNEFAQPRGSSCSYSSDWRKQKIVDGLTTAQADACVAAARSFTK